MKYIEETKELCNTSNVQAEKEEENVWRNFRTRRTRQKRNFYDCGQNRHGNGRQIHQTDET